MRFEKSLTLIQDLAPGGGPPLSGFLPFLAFQGSALTEYCELSNPEHFLKVALD